MKLTLTSSFRTVTLAAALALAAGGALAETTIAVTTTTAKAETTTAPGSFDSRQTRDELRALLQRHPHEVGVVLKLDPSLFQNEQWIASYPELRDFVRKHPEVALNSTYFLESVWVPGEFVPEPPAVRAATSMLQGLAFFSVFLVVVAALTWLIRTLLEHRRWSRVSKVQTDIYNKLLDRFTSHEDLLRYVQSAAGKDFIQSAISPISAGGAPQVAAPISRILWSAQVGVILVALGFGLEFVSSRLHPDVASSAYTLGVLALCAGLGFAISAIVAWVVSRKLGILPASGEKDETEPGSARTLGE